MPSSTLRGARQHRDYWSGSVRSALQGGLMATLICARCKTEVREEDAQRDPVGRAYHRMCYEIAYPEAPKNGVTLTGIDIPFLDLVVLFVKITLAWIPVAFVF